MFRTIVWATDGSEGADRALEHAKELASLNGTKLFALHVEPRFVGGRMSGQPVLADEEGTQAKISAQVGAARESGLEVALEVVRVPAGETPAAIASFAGSVDADVIVVGTRGRSSLAGVLLGSTTQALLHETACPVLAVPPAARG